MEFVSGNIFIRRMGSKYGLEPGQVIHGHTHNFDHTSIFFCGTWKVQIRVPLVNKAGIRQHLSNGEPAWIETENFERDGPFHLLIKAENEHTITFIGPEVGEMWCVYSHRTPQGEITQHPTGWAKAYE